MCLYAKTIPVFSQLSIKKLSVRSIYYVFMHGPIHWLCLELDSSSRLQSRGTVIAVQRVTKLQDI